MVQYSKTPALGVNLSVGAREAAPSLEGGWPARPCRRSAAGGGQQTAARYDTLPQSNSLYGLWHRRNDTVAHTEIL